MKWKRTGREKDVIDRRGGGGGRMGGVPMKAGGGVSIVGIIVVLAITLLGGGTPNFDIATGLGGAQVTDGEPIPAGEDPDRDLRDFSVYVFSDAQDTWVKIFRAEGKSYDRAKLVLYNDATNTDGCGLGQAAAGPFYCPADNRVYLDLSFYRAMERQLNAPGDFAWAYVIAHEVAHHVQNQLGISSEVDRLSRENPDDRNPLSVRQELQADCYAGVWAKAVFDQLEDGDIEEAMTASEAVGDDRLQESAGRRVDPHSFTHGTSAQRLRWFKRGLANGEPGECDTFGADEL